MPDALLGMSYEVINYLFCAGKFLENWKLTTDVFTKFGCFQFFWVKKGHLSAVKTKTEKGKTEKYETHENKTLSDLKSLIFEVCAVQFAFYILTTCKSV